MEIEKYEWRKGLNFLIMITKEKTDMNELLCNTRASNRSKLYDLFFTNWFLLKCQHQIIISIQYALVKSIKRSISISF